jgi:hypothetical protein
VDPLFAPVDRRCSMGQLLLTIFDHPGRTGPF